MVQKSNYGEARLFPNPYLIDKHPLYTKIDGGFHIAPIHGPFRLEIWNEDKKKVSVIDGMTLRKKRIYIVRFDPVSMDGRPLPNGVYAYMATTTYDTITSKFLIKKYDPTYGQRSK